MQVLWEVPTVPPYLITIVSRDYLSYIHLAFLNLLGLYNIQQLHLNYTVILQFSLSSVSHCFEMPVSESYPLSDDPLKSPENWITTFTLSVSFGMY